MNNLSVKYINVPEEIKQQMSDVFAMGWSELDDPAAIPVQFLGYDKPEGFRLLVGTEQVYFDYMNECYSIETAQPQNDTSFTIHVLRGLHNILHSNHVLKFETFTDYERQAVLDAIRYLEQGFVPSINGNNEKAPYKPEVEYSRLEGKQSELTAMNIFVDNARKKLMGANFEKAYNGNKVTTPTGSMNLIKSTSRGENLTGARTVSNFKLNASNVQYDVSTWKCFTCGEIGKGTAIPESCPSCGTRSKAVPFHKAVSSPVSMNIWVAEGLEIFNSVCRHIKSVHVRKPDKDSVTVIPGYAIIETIRQTIGPTPDCFVDAEVLYPMGSVDGDTSNTVLVSTLRSCTVGENQIRFDYYENGKGYITFIF